MGARSECRPADAKSNGQPGGASCSRAPRQITGGSSRSKALRQISGEWLGDALTAVCAFTMFLGPGIALNSYIVTVGYYEYAFKSKLFFIMMCFAAYGPFPLVLTAQAALDAYFDRAFTTHATYPFRIFVGLLLIQALVVTWMYLPATEGVAIGVGFALGTSCCTVQASGHQMISAIDPTKLTFAEIGGTLGAAMPIVMIWALDFKPSATPKEFREFIATVAIVNFLAMVMLLTLHVRGFFYKAYARLAYDLDVDLSDSDDEEDPEEAARRRQVSRDAANTRLLDEPMEASYRAASEQDRVAQKHSPRENVKREQSPRERTIPRWIYFWQVTKFFTTALQAFIVSLASFYGDPANTQFLASLKLASEFVGKASSLPVVRSEHFGTGPWHRFLVATVVARVVMVAVMFAQLWRPVLPEPIFAAMWCFFAILDRMVATLSDVTCGASVKFQDRKFVSRMSLFTGFGGVILGLGGAALLAVSMASRMDRLGTALLDTGSRGFTWGLHSWGLYHYGSAGDFGKGRALRAAVPHFVLHPR